MKEQPEKIFIHIWVKNINVKSNKTRVNTCKTNMVTGLKRLA